MLGKYVLLNIAMSMWYLHANMLTAFFIQEDTAHAAFLFFKMFTIYAPDSIFIYMFHWIVKFMGPTSAPKAHHISSYF